jgi:spore coat polysaccharide biosynthesis protein SpsF
LNRTSQFVFVAVRLKSTRLLRKALADIAGNPLLLRLVNRVAERFPKDKIVLCTSVNPQDDEIEELARQYGINFYRGDEQDVIARFIGAADLYGATTIARVTGDNPLTDPDMLMHLFECHEAADAEYSYCDDLPVGTRAEIIDVAALRRIHSQLSDPSQSEYMTYMLRRPDKMDILSASTPNFALKRPELSLTVDTEADIALIRSIYEHFGTVIPPLADIIYWLDTVPELRITVDPPPAMPPKWLNCSYQDDLAR